MEDKSEILDKHTQNTIGKSNQIVCNIVIPFFCAGLFYLFANVLVGLLILLFTFLSYNTDYNECKMTSRWFYVIPAKQYVCQAVTWMNRDAQDVENDN